MSTERKPAISNNLPTILAKATERDRLQSDVEAWLRKSGNKIQKLKPGESSQPLKRAYRDLVSPLSIQQERERRRRLAES